MSLDTRRVVFERLDREIHTLLDRALSHPDAEVALKLVRQANELQRRLVGGA